MSDIIDVRRRLMAAGAELSRGRRMLAEFPEEFGLAVSVESVEEHYHELEVEFLAIAAAQSQEVVSYRLFREQQPRHAPGLSAVCRILAEFQELFTLTFDAVKNGAKRQAQVTAGIRQLTQFELGYTFPGSLGVVMTVPRDRQQVLFGDVATIEARTEMMAMMHARAPEEVRRIASAFGLPVVRSLLRLAQLHTAFDVGADIEWCNSDEPTHFFEPEDLRTLEETILETSAETTEEVSVFGELTGVNVRRKTFEIDLDDGTVITGKFEDAIDAAHTVELPKRYRATLWRTTTVRPAVDEHKEEYFLADLLGPIGSADVVELQTGVSADS